eukprot:TRINITY_DN6744_c0_g2_i1.p1 TRINITY_DN6744_c0_g2~~TRINITY_DN6744_c0_g2_i1.p1  ORF type:complete len:492 (+),score=94.12 TRINITY_DN6744_c0_g2_i1:3-1478(+)
MIRFVLPLCFASVTSASSLCWKNEFYRPETDLHSPDYSPTATCSDGPVVSAHAAVVIAYCVISLALLFSDLKIFNHLEPGPPNLVELGTVKFLRLPFLPIRRDIYLLYCLVSYVINFAAFIDFAFVNNRMAFPYTYEHGEFNGNLEAWALPYIGSLIYHCVIVYYAPLSVAATPHPRYYSHSWLRFVEALLLFTRSRFVFFGVYGLLALVQFGNIIWSWAVGGLLLVTMLSAMLVLGIIACCSKSAREVLEASTLSLRMLFHLKSDQPGTNQRDVSEGTLLRLINLQPETEPQKSEVRVVLALVGKLYPIIFLGSPLFLYVLYRLGKSASCGYDCYTIAEICLIPSSVQTVAIFLQTSQLTLLIIIGGLALLSAMVPTPHRIEMLGLCSAVNEMCGMMMEDLQIKQAGGSSEVAQALEKLRNSPSGGWMKCQWLPMPNPSSGALNPVPFDGSTDKWMSYLTTLEPALVAAWKRHCPEKADKYVAPQAAGTV